MTYSAIEQRLKDNEVVILDGAIGTELERLGAPMHQDAWCAAAMETHPSLISAVHRSYIEAGADVITANTYASTRMALERGGLGEQMRPWNELAMRMARQTIEESSNGRPVCLAGSVSTFGLFGDTPVEDQQIRRWFEEQAEILVGVGADLLLVETLAADMSTVVAAVESTARFDVPVWVAISGLVDRDSGELRLGVEESQEHSASRRSHELLSEAVERTVNAGANTLLLMHSDLKAIRPALEVMRAHHDGWLGVYPNAGHWLRPQWAFVDQVEPVDFVAEAEAWYDTGARILGGCCGIGPDHITALSQRFR
jgi:methionine synthase I (cobalamin-dependent)